MRGKEVIVGGRWCGNGVQCSCLSLEHTFASVVVAAQGDHAGPWLVGRVG